MVDWGVLYFITGKFCVRNVTLDYDVNMFLCYVNLIFFVVLDL